MESPAATIAMIGAACADLGERALVCAGLSDFRNVPSGERVKELGQLDELCGDLSGLPSDRAPRRRRLRGRRPARGVPTLILWAAADRQMWGAIIKRLQVGTARRFSSTTQESLVADLRQIMAPHYVARAARSPST